jgi:hypothetical protein
MAQLFHEESIRGVLEEMDHPTLGDRTTLRSTNNGSRVLAAASAPCEKQLCKNGAPGVIGRKWGSRSRRTENNDPYFHGQW